MMYEHPRRVVGRVYQNLVTHNFDGELKDILLLLLTAGADPYARNETGDSVSDVASGWGHENEWWEALEECGYDADEVVGAEEKTLARSSGIDVKDRAQYRPLLGFAEYLQIRKTRHVEELDDSDEEHDCDSSEEEHGDSTSDDEEVYSDDRFDSQEASDDKEARRDGNDEDDAMDWEWNPEGPQESWESQDMEEVSTQQTTGSCMPLDEADLRAMMLDAYKTSKHKSA